MKVKTPQEKCCRFPRMTTASNFSTLTQLSICLNDQNVESCLIAHAST